MKVKNLISKAVATAALGGSLLAASAVSHANGLNVIFIMDSTGSTGHLMDDWKANMPAVTQPFILAGLAADEPYTPRFALVEQRDFPFPNPVYPFV